MKLSEHFSLEEFENSSTASKYGIDNRVPEEFIPSIQNLCVTVLEPLRVHFNEPVKISSGFRSAALDKVVASPARKSKVSQHSKGEAADIYGPSTEPRLREWYDWIKDNCDFDQLIWETSKTTGNKWIHVSCCLDTHKNRKSAFSLVQ